MISTLKITLIKLFTLIFYPYSGQFENTSNWDQKNIQIDHHHNPGNQNVKNNQKQKKRSVLGINLVKKHIFNIVDHDLHKTGRYFKKQNPDLNSDEMWVDDIYPPNPGSLTFVPLGHEQADILEPEEISDLQTLSWKRCNEVMKNNYVLYDKIEIEDIHQGQIGNCYFLCALSAIAEFKERFDRIFITKKRTSTGAYQVRLVIHGIPKIVTVDNHFIVDRRSHFAGATSGRGEIWVQVLEKAWAKACKSYAMTIAGTPGEALSSLTQAPVVSYIHRKYPGESKLELWEIIKLADDQKYIICTNTGGNKDFESVGLVCGHAYTVIGVHETNDQSLKLVQLRNPWGSFEWKGDFSDKSKTWGNYPGLKEQLVEDRDDGIFFMTFDDFLKYFPYTFISKYKNGAKYSFQKVHQASHNTMCATKINITATTNIAIGLHQRQGRFYSKIQKYKSQMARIIVAKYNPSSQPQYEFIGTDSNNNEKLYVIDTLKPGEYHIFTNTSWPYKENNNKYVISTYADYEVPLEKIECNQIPDDYITQVLSSFVDKTAKGTKVSEMATYQTSFGFNDTGFYIFKVNNTTDSQHLAVNFSYSANDKCEFYSKHLTNDVKRTPGENGMSDENVNFNIAPNKSGTLIWRLMDNPWSCKFELKGMKCDKSSGERESTYEQKDPFKKLIEENISSLPKEHITVDCVYTELEVEDGILVILENIATDKVYRMKVVFPQMVNAIYAEANSVFTVRPGCYDYVRLKKRNLAEDLDYTISLSVKQV